MSQELRDPLPVAMRILVRLTHVRFRKQRKQTTKG